jgi:hypothetical protein
MAWILLPLLIEVFINFVFSQQPESCSRLLSVCSRDSSEIARIAESTISFCNSTCFTYTGCSAAYDSAVSYYGLMPSGTIPTAYPINNNSSNSQVAYFSFISRTNSDDLLSCTGNDFKASLITGFRSVADALGIDCGRADYHTADFLQSECIDIVRNVRPAYAFSTSS